MAEKSDDKPTPPYVSFKTFKNFLRSMAQGIPNRIDKSVMPSMSGANQVQLLHALRYLSLIDQRGEPGDMLDVLATSSGDTYQTAFQEVLRAAYPFLRDASGFDLAKATDGQLDEQFKKLAQGDTVRKCKTFFLPAVKDAGLAISPYIKELGKRAPSSGGRQRGRPAKERPDRLIRTEERHEQHTPAPQFPSVHPALAGMLHELPKPGTNWSPGQKDAFVKAFRSILDVVYP